MIQLNELALKELDVSEAEQLNGGWFQAALAVTAALIYLYNEGPDFVEGFKEAFNTVTKPSQI